MMPCVFLHFCIPFSPACVACYCISKRKTDLREIVEEFNEEKALYQGIFAEWNDDYFKQYQPRPTIRRRGRRGSGRIVVEPALKPALNILMNLPKRQEFCANNRIPFQIPILSQPPPMVAPPAYGVPDIGAGGFVAPIATDAISNKSSSSN